MAVITTNIATMARAFKIETCNKNQVPLGFGQSSTWTCYRPSCQPSWIVAIAKITKMTTTALSFKIETCNKNQTPLSLGQSSSWRWCCPSCQSSWMAATTKNLNNDYHVFTIQDRDLQLKPNTTIFESDFNLNMLLAILSAILDWSHYLTLQRWLPWLCCSTVQLELVVSCLGYQPEMIEMVTMALLFKIETRNESLINLQH